MSRSTRIAPRGSRLIFSASAERYVTQNGLAAAFAETALPTNCLVGDLVTIAEVHTFAIVRRRWIASQDEAILELTLDYPAR